MELFRQLGVVHPAYEFQSVLGDSKLSWTRTEEAQDTAVRRQDQLPSVQYGVREWRVTQQGSTVAWLAEVGTGIWKRWQWVLMVYFVVLHSTENHSLCTPWIRFPSVKLVVAQMRPRSEDPILRQMNSLHTSCPISFRSVLILFSHKCLSLLTVFFFQVTGQFYKKNSLYF